MLEHPRVTGTREVGCRVGAVVGNHHDLVQLSRVFELLDAAQQRRKHQRLVVGRDHHCEAMSRRRCGADRLLAKATDQRRPGEQREVASEQAAQQDECPLEQAQDCAQDIHQP
jgi:hypothetical protein